MKLTHKLVLAFVVLIGVPVFLLGHYLSRAAADAIEQQTIDHLTAVNRLKGEELDRWLSDREAELAFLAARPSVQDQVAAFLESDRQGAAARDNLVENQLRPYLRPGGYVQLFFLDPETGVVLLSTDPTQEGLERGSEQYFVNGRAQTYTQNPHVSPRLGALVMTVATPVVSGGETLVAVLAGHVDLGEVSEIAAQAWDVSNTEETYIIDGTRRLITEPRLGGTGWLFEPVETEGVVRAVAGETGWAVYSDYRGVEVMGAYEWISSRQLGILTEMDLGEALGAVRRVRSVQLWVGALAAATAVALGIVFARRLVRPARQLVAATEILGRGDLAHRVRATSRDELGRLGRAFNAMAESLQNTTASRDELDREVVRRKDVEAELRRSMNELERSNEDLQRFAYVASHDLQEPLRMVSSYTQLLAKRYGESLDGDAKEFIHYAVDGANRMQRLINDLLAYSRVRTRGNPFRPTDLNGALGQARVNVSAAIKESGAVVTHEELPVAPCDEAQMVSVFQNLLSNAVKFRGEEPPRIHVSVIDRDDAWEIRVRDNGIGIAEEFHDRVFVIFQRLHARSDYPGTGIGLALVKRIVERHGGKVGLESTAGKGTTFWFTLPKEQSAEPTGEGAAMGQGSRVMGKRDDR